MFIIDSFTTANVNEIRKVHTSLVFDMAGFPAILHNIVIYSCITCNNATATVLMTSNIIIHSLVLTVSRPE